MAQPILLQNRFDGGMKPDLSRDQLPRNAVYNIEDFLPDLGAPLRKRGGWTYEGVALTSLNASAGNVRHVLYAPFTAGGQVLAFDDSLNRLFDVTNGVDRGVAQDHVQAPIFYRDLVIIGSAASATPLKYSGSGAPSALGGTPPASRSFAVYNDRLCAASDTVAPINRIWFSAPGNPESWDTTNAWIGSSAVVKALAAIPKAVFVFHDGSVEILRGDVFPSADTPATSVTLSLQPLLANVGIYGPNAFAVNGDTVYWADRSGVYLSDGAAFTDLTLEGEIKNYWIDKTTEAGPGFCAVGFYNGYLFVSLLNSARAFGDFLLCDPKKRAWFRFTPIRAKNFSPQLGDVDAFYFSNQSTKRVGDLATTFLPDVDKREDADALSILPLLETSFYTQRTEGKKRWKYLYLGYDMRDPVSDNPALTSQYATSPESTSYTTLSPTLTETTAFARKRMPISVQNRGLSFYIQQFGNSADTRIYALEAELAPLEASRR